MKELNLIKSKYIGKFDIEVNKYLTYTQIQQIINACEKMDTWAEREQCIDMLILYHTTNIEKEKIEEIGHDKLLQSGLIDEVKKEIINLDTLYCAIDYNESLERNIIKLAKQIPTLNSKLKEVMEKNAKINKK